jgi:hypothetical protein
LLKHIFNSRYTVVILGDRKGEKERDRDSVFVCVRERERERERERGSVCVNEREREQKYVLIIATRGYFRTIKSV